MHRKYAADGFLMISVSLDEPKESTKKAKVLKFLEAQKADFPNLILSDSAEVWQKNLKIDGPPCIYVFNRAGQWEKKYDDKIDQHLKEIEGLVRDLLKKK